MPFNSEAKLSSQGYAPPARQVVSECCSSSQTSSDFAVRFLCAAPKRYWTRTKHDHQNKLWAILSLSDCARLRKNSYKNSDFDHAAWNVFVQVIIPVTRGSTRNSCSECWWRKCWPSYPPSGFRRLHLKSGWLEDLLVTVTSWIKYIIVLLVVELNCNVFKFLFLQVCNHRLLVAKSLAQSLGWHVIHCSRHVGTGAKERQGHVGGLMVKSPNGNK